MFKRIAASVLVGALLCALGAPVAHAQTLPMSNAKVGEMPDSISAVKKEALAGANLKAEVIKLIIDAKANKGLSIPGPQIQPRQSNGLSKGAKIGIVVGAAVAIILIIVFVHARNHLFDDFRLSN